VEAWAQGHGKFCQAPFKLNCVLPSAGAVGAVGYVYLASCATAEEVAMHPARQKRGGEAVWQSHCTSYDILYHIIMGVPHRNFIWVKVFPSLPLLSNMTTFPHEVMPVTDATHLLSMKHPPPPPKPTDLLTVQARSAKYR